jgi:MFS family permease
VLALMCSLAMITYLDRALNGVQDAKQQVMSAVGMTVSDHFYLLVAFQIAYALFEVPAGWLGDVYGPRGTLLRIVLWWSFCIGLMALAGVPLFGGTVAIGFWGLVVIQFFFGMGEAGAFPNIAKALYSWFPASQRAFVQGAVWFSSRIMGGLTPFLWVLLVSVGGMSWRIAIVVFAGFGLVWCAAFYWYYRNKPQEHPGTNEAERQLIEQGKTPRTSAYEGVPWGRLLRQKNLWYLCGMYLCQNFGWYFLMFFLPGYMEKVFDITKDNSAASKLGVALLTGAPLLLGSLACLWGGAFSDAFIRRTGDRTWGRRLVGMVGYGLCSLAYIAAVFVQGSPYLLILCIALVGFFNDLTLGAAWATAQDVGRRYAAIVAGFMNMIGNLGGALGNYLTGAILRHYRSAGLEDDGYVICLTMYAVAYGIGVVFWYLTDANKPLAED